MPGPGADRSLGETLGAGLRAGRGGREGSGAARSWEADVRCDCLRASGSARALFGGISEWGTDWYIPELFRDTLPLPVIFRP